MATSANRCLKRRCRLPHPWHSRDSGECPLDTGTAGPSIAHLRVTTNPERSLEEFSLASRAGRAANWGVVAVVVEEDLVVVVVVVMKVMVVVEVVAEPLPRRWWWRW